VYGWEFVGVVDTTAIVDYGGGAAWLADVAGFVAGRSGCLAAIGSGL